MRNISFLLLLLLLPAVLFSKDRRKKKKHKELKIPVSRWREVSRMMPDSTVVEFSDTLFVQFRPKDSFQYYNLNGFKYKGAYTIDEDSLLDFGTARYKISIKRPNVLVLQNEAGFVHLGPDHSILSPNIVLDTSAEKPGTVADIDQMIGHWTVYKRVAKEQGSIIDPEISLTAAYITGASTDGKLGYIYGGLDARNSPSWYIKALGVDQVLECDGKSLRILKVIKCDNGEMILEEKDIKFYFKQFK